MGHPFLGWAPYGEWKKPCGCGGYSQPSVSPENMPWMTWYYPAPYISHVPPYPFIPPTIQRKEKMDKEAKKQTKQRFYHSPKSVPKDEFESSWIRVYQRKYSDG